MDDIYNLEDKAEAVVQEALAIQHAVGNIVAAYSDGEKWVVRDNLRRIPILVSRAHLEFARLLVMTEQIDNSLPL